MSETVENRPQIRALTIDDHDDLLELWRRAELGHRPAGRDARENVQKEMLANPHGFIGGFVENRLVASALASFDGRKGWINRVAVDPDYRGRGYGLLMIAEAERVLHQHFGAQIIAALVEPENIPSKELFAKAEYKLWEGLYYFSKRNHPDV